MEWLQNRTARWGGGAVLLCLLLVTAAWFVLISPRLAEAADLSNQNVAAQEANDALRLRLKELQAQFAMLADTRASLDEIRRQLPAGAEIPAFVRAVDALATSSGVELVSLTPSEAEAVGATSEGSSAAVKAGGLVAVPVSIVVTGDYFETVAFLRQLQSSGPRALLVSQLTLTTEEGKGDAMVKVALGGKIFVLPDGTAATGTATVGGSGSASGASGTAPAGTTSGAPTVTTTPTPGITQGTATRGTPTATSSTASGGTTTVALGEPLRSYQAGSLPW
jgi:type IV pilus assembly protein PilO